MDMKEKTKLCVIPEGGILPIREGIHGPIHNPSEFTVREVVTLITNGIKIYEVNPYNKKKRILLTLQNATSDNFPMRKRAKVITSEQMKVRKIHGNSSNSIVRSNSYVNDEKSVNDSVSSKTTQRVSKPDFF